MLTSKNTSEDIVKGLENGADDYISKPITLDKLQKVINQYTSLVSSASQRFSELPKTFILVRNEIVKEL